MKKFISSLLAIIFALSTFGSVFSASAENVTAISMTAQLKNAFKNGGSYELSRDLFSVYGFPIEKDVKLNGKEYSINAQSNGGSSATFYQNEYVSSSFSNVVFKGTEKADVGIWVGSGTMSFDSCTVSDFTITSNRMAALAAGGGAQLILNDTVFNNNLDYDVGVFDYSTAVFNGSTAVNSVVLDYCSTLNINDSSTVSNIYYNSVSSGYSLINIGENWSGTTSITFKNPVSRIIGSVAEGADISNITVTNSGCRLENQNSKLVLICEENETAIHFDMNTREALFKGSTGFLYGEAEINVPSIDLICGLQPETMVQKVYAGKQHPTADAIRTSSALLSAGVKDMEVYLQDHYLEWPYDAPRQGEEIDLDSYQKTVEEILYAMICDEAQQGDEGAFSGSDGKYYVLNDNKDLYNFVLFNEPDQIWYWNNLEGLKAAWKKIYNAVHAIYPDARCAGPNFAGYNKDSYDSFLSFCYDNNCLPEVITWHELGDSSLTDFYTHYDEIKEMQAKYYTQEYALKTGRSYQPKLLVNEYARHYDIGAPGGLVKWLSMFEDKDMSGCLAYWAMANTLNELAADQNSPTSSWWVYHWYAQMTGEQCPLVSPEFDKTRFYGLTSYDEDNNTAYVLFGGCEDKNGCEAVYLDNMDETNLVNDYGDVYAKIYNVGFSGQLGTNYKPDLVYEGYLGTEDNTLKIAMNNTDEMQAYFAVLSYSNTIGGYEINLSNPVYSYEAEDADLLGGATAYSKGGWSTFATSGRAEVGSINNNGDGVKFTVTVPEDGYYSASLFYSLQAPYVNPKTLEPDANGQNRGIGKSLPYGVELDGEKQENIVLESTASWAYKSHCDMAYYLTAGEHTLTFKHINGDEGNKGNLQLVAALDKLDIKKFANNENDFEIDLREMKSFKEWNGYRVTAVAPAEGYYYVSSSVSISKQNVDYASDAKSFSKCGVYDVPIDGSHIYLNKGANTLYIEGGQNLVFHYEDTFDIDTGGALVVKSSDITLHGNSPVLKKNAYANSGYVISELGIGQNPDKNDKAEYNYATFKVRAKKDGRYNFTINYSNDEPAPVMLKSDGTTYLHPYNMDLVERYAQISVNGGEPETVYFKNTLSWDTFKTVSVQFDLKEGINEIKIYNDNSYQFSSLVNSTAPEISSIVITNTSDKYSQAEFVKGAKSTTHSFNTVSSKVITPATLSANGKLENTVVCSECGYKTTRTETINKIVSCTLSKTTYTYNGKVQKPSVTVKDSKGKTIASGNYTLTYSNKNSKAYGKYTVKITFKGNYKGTKTLTYYISPKGTTVSKITSPKSKQLKVTWKKQTSNTNGYQIQIATDIKFTKDVKSYTVTSNKTTSKTLTGLKSKKKYFVRIRTYKTVKGVKCYSTWSGSKYATTKK